MQTKTMYRYARADGGVSVAFVLPEGVTEYDLRYRLIADEGKALTDGVTVAECVDTATPDDWTEIDAPADEDEEAQYAEAGKILMGVAE